jgi:hypothetical protein
MFIVNNLLKLLQMLIMISDAVILFSTPILPLAFIWCKRPGGFWFVLPSLPARL